MPEVLSTLQSKSGQPPLFPGPQKLCHRISRVSTDVQGFFHSGLESIHWMLLQQTKHTDEFPGPFSPSFRLQPPSQDLKAIG